VIPSAVSGHGGEDGVCPELALAAARCCQRGPKWTIYAYRGEIQQCCELGVASLGLGVSGMLFYEAGWNWGSGWLW